MEISKQNYDVIGRDKSLAGYNRDRYIEIMMDVKNLAHIIFFGR